ncbi:MAG: hypothetical protein IJQ06_08200 [Paludibacteraceae bacterium]|nr:hypothetical protein [Paludibacteraceae bacterium]
MKKTLRYLLSMIAVVSVLGVSAQTPRYGTLYKGQGYAYVYASAQSGSDMPTATMGSTNSEYMQTGSALPSAIKTGVVTTYDNTPSGPRKIGGGNSGGGDGPTNPDDVWGTPICDAVVPLMLLAMAYMAVRIMRKRRGALSK